MVQDSIKTGEHESIQGRSWAADEQEAMLPRGSLLITVRTQLQGNGIYARQLADVFPLLE